MFPLSQKLRPGLRRPCSEIVLWHRLRNNYICAISSPVFLECFGRNASCEKPLNPGAKTHNPKRSERCKKKWRLQGFARSLTLHADTGCRKPGKPKNP